MFLVGWTIFYFPTGKNPHDQTEQIAGAMITSSHHTTPRRFSRTKFMSVKIQQ